MTISSQDDQAFNALRNQKEELERKTTEAYTNTLEKLRSEVAEAKQKMANQQQQQVDPAIDVTLDVPTVEKENENPQKDQKFQDFGKQHLIYFSYSMYGYDEHPLWAIKLKEVLTNAGYLVFNPWVPVAEQFSNMNRLDSLQKRVIPAICPLLKLPEAVTYPIGSVGHLITKAETSGDHDCFIFRSMWFLSRASLVICDLTRSPLGMGVAQELLYSKLFDVPSVGILPDSGHTNAWIGHSTTVLLPSTFNALTIIPIIRGYAPL